MVLCKERVYICLSLLVLYSWGPVKGVGWCCTSLFMSGKGQRESHQGCKISPRCDCPYFWKDIYQARVRPDHNFSVKFSPSVVVSVLVWRFESGISVSFRPMVWNFAQGWTALDWETCISLHWVWQFHTMGVNFSTGVNFPRMRSLHFCGLGLTISHQSVNCFTVVNWSGLTCLYFYWGWGLKVSHQGCDIFHRCELLWNEKSAFAWIVSDGFIFHRCERLWVKK